MYKCVDCICCTLAIYHRMKAVIMHRAGRSIKSGVCLLNLCLRLSSSLCLRVVDTVG